MSLLYLLDILALIALGLSGGSLAARKGMDFFGAMFLAVATALGGGMLSDMLLGRTPEALREEWILPLAAATGLVAFFLGERLKGFTLLIAYLDAIGLGLYAVAGAQRGLTAGTSLAGIAFLGVLTGSGGGMLRDVLAGEIPFVLRRELYASVAAGGALVYGLMFPYFEGSRVLGFGVAAVVTVIRIFALRLGIHARPNSTPPAVPR